MSDPAKNPALSALFETLKATFAAEVEADRINVNAWVLGYTGAEGAGVRGAGCSCTACTLRIMEVMARDLSERHGIDVRVFVAGTGDAKPSRVH